MSSKNQRSSVFSVGKDTANRIGDHGKNSNVVITQDELDKVRLDVN